MTFSRIIAVFAIIGIIGYLGFHIRNLVAPPLLVLENPPQGFITSDHTIEIQGNTDPGARVEINGSPLLIAQTGAFSRVLVLSKGINKVTVSAKKRHSRPAVIEREVLILEGETISQRHAGGI